MNEELLQEKQNDTREVDKLYRIVEEYAEDHGLTTLKSLLPVSRELLFDRENEEYQVRIYSFRHFLHGLKVCKILIDLILPLSKEDIDRVLSMELCHVLLEIVWFPERGEELNSRYGVECEILELARKLSSSDYKLAEASEEEHYEEIQKNKLTLLVKLAEMSILTEQLYRISLDEVQEYLRLTERYYFPMCIYAKEHYTELTMVVSTLMEKVRLLSYVTEILSDRYRARERALRQEMLGLREENARIRVSIRELEEERAAKESL